MAGDQGGELGIEIPKGDPDALRAAGELWSGMGDVLEREGGVLDGAASTVVAADWRGEASSRYSFASLGVSLAMTTGAGSCRDVAEACRRFATALKDAQEDAKRALKEARAAKVRLDKAKVQVGAAKKRLAGALSAAQSASTRLNAASAAGPVGAGQAQVAQGELTDAQNAANDAERDIKVWTDRLRDAQSDLKDAQKDGKQANERAQRAGRSAAGEFGGLAGEAQEPVMVGGGASPMGSAVVPVTVPAAVAARAAGNPFGPNGGLAGNPFARPGSPGNPFSITPGVIRQRQITEAQQRAAAEAQAAKERKEGGVGDGLSGLVNGWTFGLVDLGGNKKSDRYKRGELASLIPLTPMGLAKDAEKGIAKGGEKLLGKEASRAGEKQVAKSTREVSFTRQELLSGAARDSRIGKTTRQAAEAGLPAPKDGMTVYRVYGRSEDLMKPGGARPGGQSWTPVDPATLKNPRADLGLPDENTGRFVVEARLRDASDVETVRRALPADGQPGGAAEYIIKNPDLKVQPVGVKGVNPDF